ncbi:MAG: BON domain-containing protein [Armatimonadota bacterium]|nr:BON domain-containing protein [bacterium]
MAVGNRLKAMEIKANLIGDDRVRLMEIDVEVDGYLAILSGDVETDEQKRLAEELAFEVDGIQEIENNIQVVSPPPEQASAYDGFEPRLGYGPAEGDVGDTAFSLSDDYSVPGPGVPASEQFPGEFSDEALVSEVKHMLASQREVDVSRVKIEMENQVFNLTGSVETADDLNRLQEMILRMRGVMGVNSKLKVRKGDTGTPIE